MHGKRLGGEDDLAASAEILQCRQCDLGYLSPRFGEEPNGGVERLDLFGMADDIPGVEMADDADPQACDTVAEHCAIIGRRLVCACGVASTISGR